MDPNPPDNDSVQYLSPLALSVKSASQQASHFDIKAPGYHLYETKYDSAFLLPFSLPPGSKLYTGPRQVSTTHDQTQRNVLSGQQQVGFLVIPPTFNPREVALSIEHATQSYHDSTHISHYVLTNNHLNTCDSMGKANQERRITPLQPLIALNVPTYTHSPHLPVPPSFIPDVRFPLAIGTALLAWTSFASTRTLHSRFQQALTNPAISPQQYATTFLSAMKAPLQRSGVTILATMPLLEFSLTSLMIAGCANWYRTRSIINSNYQQSKDVERKVELTNSIVSPLIVTHADPKYNIHPSALAYLGELQYTPSTTGTHKSKLPPIEIENKSISANLTQQHSALCNVALDVPQPLPSSTNLMFDVFNAAGDLVSAFTGEKMNSDRASAEYEKSAKTRQRENFLLRLLPLAFSEIPPSSYKAFAALLGITAVVTKVSMVTQKLVMNQILTKSTAVLRNLSFTARAEHSSMKIPPNFVNQIIYNQKSSVVFPSINTSMPFTAFRVFIIGLFAAYSYKLIDQSSTVAKDARVQANRPTCIGIHQEVLDNSNHHQNDQDHRNHTNTQHTSSIFTNSPNLPQPGHSPDHSSETDSNHTTISSQPTETTQESANSTANVNDAKNEALNLWSELRETISSTQLPHDKVRMNQQMVEIGHGLATLDRHYGLLDVLSQNQLMLRQIQYSHLRSLNQFLTQDNRFVNTEDQRYLEEFRKFEEKEAKKAPITPSAAAKKQQPPSALLPASPITEPNYIETLHLSINSEEAKVYPNLLKEIIPSVCGHGSAGYSTKPITVSKLYDEWVPTLPSDEQLAQKQTKMLEYLHTPEFDGKQNSSVQLYYGPDGNEIEPSYSEENQFTVLNADRIARGLPTISPSRFNTTDDVQNVENGDLNESGNKTVVTRTFWQISAPILGPALAVQSATPNVSLLSALSHFSTKLAKEFNKIQSTPSTSPSDPEISSSNPSINQVALAVSKNGPDWTSWNFMSEQIRALFTPLSKQKPLLPELDDEKKNIPALFDYIGETVLGAVLTNGDIVSYQDAYDCGHPELFDWLYDRRTAQIEKQTKLAEANRRNNTNGHLNLSNDNPLNSGERSNDKSTEPFPSSRERKGLDNQPSSYLSAIASQKLFHLLLGATLLSVPFYLTKLEYYHQRNLSYLSHTTGIPGISNVATPGMTSSSQILSSTSTKSPFASTWFLNQGMRWNNQKLFGIYNSLQSLTTVSQFTLNLIKNLFNINSTASTNTNSHNDDLSEAGKSPKDRVTGFIDKRATLKSNLLSRLRNFAGFGKYVIIYAAVAWACHNQHKRTEFLIQQQLAPSFPDHRNGIISNDLLLENDKLVYYDTHSAQNIRLKQEVQEERRKLKEKIQEKQEKESSIKFGPQQSVKRLFDNAIRRQKEQEQLDKTKSKEEEFESELDENGEIKLTKRQRFNKWVARVESYFLNQLYVAPASLERKLRPQLGNLSNIPFSTGTFMTLLNDYHRNKYIKSMQEQEEAEARADKEAEELAAAESGSVNPPNKDKSDPTAPTSSTSTPSQRTPSQLEQENYTRQLQHEKRNYKYTHLLQRSNIFMLLDQQSVVSTEFQVVFNELHKRYIHQKLNPDTTLTAPKTAADVELFATPEVPTDGTTESKTGTITTTMTTATTSSAPAPATTTVSTSEPRTYSGVPFYIVTSPV